MKLFKKRENKEKKSFEIPLKIVFLIRWFLEVMFNYVMVMTIATYVLPLLLINLGTYVGISYMTEIVDIIVLFVLPAMFVVIMAVIFYYFGMRKFHCLLNKLYNKIVNKYRKIDAEAKNEKLEADKNDCKSDESNKKNKRAKRYK